MAEQQEMITGPGIILSRARKKAGISTAEVASRINLSESIIKQLEQDQFTDDVPDAFVRGYLRAYAKLVELDPQEVLDSYTQVTGKADLTYHYRPSEDAPPPRAHAPSSMNWLLIIGILTAVLLLSFVYWNFFKNKSDDSEATAVEITTDSAGELSLSSNNSSANQVASSSNSSPVNVTQETQSEQLPITEAQTNEPATNLEQAGTESVAESASITQPVAQPVESGETALYFAFSGDCWVSVIDARGETLAVGLKSAGRRFTVRGYPPFQVVLGKPRSVTLSIAGELVDLSAYPGNQTARLTLGETP